MEQGFDRTGELVASDHPSCSYVLGEHSGRPIFYHRAQVADSQLAAPPRVMGVREFNERTRDNPRQLHFAFPVD